MTELLICSAALLLIFISSQIGAKSGAFPALSWMLASILSLLVAMRYWFLLSRALGDEANPSAAIIILCFWVPFLLVFVLITRLCATHIEQFASVAPSLANRILGTIFGATSGVVFAAALVLTLSILAPRLFSTGKPANLPIPINEMSSVAFRYLETTIAGVNETDPAHTRLPRLKESSSERCILWQ